MQTTKTTTYTLSKVEVLNALRAAYPGEIALQSPDGRIKVFGDNKGNGPFVIEVNGMATSDSREFTMVPKSAA